MRNATLTAIKILLALDDKPLKMSAIAEIVGIGRDTIEKTCRPLREAGLIHVYQGCAGGVVLGKAPDKITAWDVYRVFENVEWCKDAELRQMQEGLALTFGGLTIEKMKSIGKNVKIVESNEQG